jgi:hypothetical protein
MHATTSRASLSQHDAICVVFGSKRIEERGSEATSFDAPYTMLTNTLPYPKYPGLDRNRRRT